MESSFNEMEAIREIVKPEHLRALATWSASAKTDERAGLRMIQAIIKYQGTKRFRTKNIDQDDKDVYLADTIDITSAQERLKKKYATSSYQGDFGLHSKEQQNAELGVLQFKKYSQLPLAVMLIPKVKGFLDSWLDLNDVDKYKLQVLKCLRSLFALVSTQAVATSAYKTHYQFNKALVTPVERIDKRLFAKTAYVGTKPVQPLVEAAQTARDKPVTSMLSAAGSAMLKLDGIRDEMLRGNGCITASCFVPDKMSLYQASYKNPIIGAVQIGKMKFDTSTSLATGGICPEPAVLRRLQDEKTRHIQDSKLLSRTNFQFQSS